MLAYRLLDSRNGYSRMRSRIIQKTRSGCSTPPAAPRKVTFSADALFDFDKATLKAEGIRSLDEFASGIQTVSYDRIHVDGYADRIGSDDYNKRLSFRRAQAVKAHLVSRRISAEKISIDGKGEADPVTGNSCDGIRVSKQLKQCLAPDRRVEIETFGMQQ